MTGRSVGYAGRRIKRSLNSSFREHKTDGEGENSVGAEKKEGIC